MQLLDLPGERRRRAFLTYFEELFADFNSPNTFRAIAALAVDGATPDALASACEFRREATLHPYLLALGANAKYRPVVTWSRALDITQLVEGDDPLDHLEPDWFDEWLGLPSSDYRSWCFLEFFEDRLRAKAAGYWDLARSESQATGPHDLVLARSGTGALLYAVPSQVGALNVAQPSLSSFHLRSTRLGTADSRMLGTGQA